MRILSVENVITIIEQHGLDRCLQELREQLASDFARWPEFTKMPRPAMHVPDGVIELMPICDREYYAFKYVNGHPKNPDIGKQTVMATGQLARTLDGTPLLYSEMTVLTALRTAATSALATDLMARKDVATLAVIGTGAQSEFQVRALSQIRPITEIRYFDTDPQAMKKFEHNLQSMDIQLHAAETAKEAAAGADIITVCTACKQHVDVLKAEWIQPGVHINALGGDCPGKTELELDILKRAKVVVEYFEQSFIEGEIQRFDRKEAQAATLGELFEFVTGRKQARRTDQDITVFDSVGIALEDYSALRWIYDLSDRYEVGQSHTIIPPLHDPKNLFDLTYSAAQSAVTST